MEFTEKKVAIIGFGVVGKSAASFCLKRGAHITLFDEKAEEDFSGDEQKEIISKGNFVQYQGGITGLDDFDYIISSPGISRYREDIEQASRAGVPVFTDITLFLELWDGTGPVIGVTGSNGKSTVVSLFEEALKAAKVPVLMGGNIGNSPLEWLDDVNVSRESFVVLELSSYMLEYFTERHILDVSVIISLTQNHLSRHGTLEEYARVKCAGIHPVKTKVYLGDTQGVHQYIVPHLPEGVNPVWVDPATAEDFDFNLDAMRMFGSHNALNISLVASVLNQFNLVNEEVKQSLLEYPGLEHRIQRVTLDEQGVLWVNDSKSTSPDATCKAIEAVGGEKNVVLIAGGVDKGVRYDEWEDYFKKYLKAVLILPGPAEEQIVSLARKLHISWLTAEDQQDKENAMRELVEEARSIADVGDVVLLSPGAASLNLWNGFEARGESFKKAIEG